MHASVTALVLTGQHALEDVARLLWDVPGLSTTDLIGTEAIRVGSAGWQGDSFTHVSLALWDRTAFGSGDSPELAPSLKSLASTLSVDGVAVVIQVDGVAGVASFARYEGGQPVEVDRVHGDVVPLITRAVAPVLGVVDGIDDLMHRLDLADGEPLDAPVDEEDLVDPRRVAARTRERPSRLKGLLGRIKRRR